MRNYLIIPAMVIVSLTAALQIQGEEILRIVYPPDRAALEGGAVEIIGLAPDAVGEVEIAVSNGQPADGSTAGVEHGAFAKLVRLARGRARIEVTAGNASATIEVYVRRPGDAAPAGYRIFHRHREFTAGGECGTCHKLDGRRMSYRRLRPAATCQDGGCHAEMGAQRFVHGPVGSGTCIHCHNPHGSLLPAEVSRAGKDLCIVCHRDAEWFWEKPNVHSPVAEGDCTGCHDPHESDTRFQLLGSSAGATCFNCHDEESTVGGEVTHEPVQQLECTLCHNPHAGEHPFLLAAEGNAVCFSCHQGQEEELAQKVQHEPVLESCLGCHDAHTEDHPYMLSAAPGDLCVECHRQATPSFVAELENVSVHHPPVEESDCIACHVPHATAFAKLLQDEAPQLCFGCHQEMGQQVTESEYPHGPMWDGDCSACHQTHGSANPKILNAFFPAEFYNPYAEELYQLCFECHDADVAREEHTTELTDFRNGTRNLHYLHVHREKKGRSCKACHEVHAGPQEKHIRDEVPFGDMWSYPITFTRNENGGSCVVGCHKPKAYDRVEPVRYE